MNENDYLELVNQLKKKFDENEMKVNIFIKQNIKLKKHIMALHGFCKMFDRLDEYVDTQEREFVLGHMMSYLSDVIDNEILSCPSINLRSSSDIVEVEV